MELTSICQRLSHAEAHFLLEEIADFVQTAEVQRWVMSDFAKGYESGRESILNEIAKRIKEYDIE